MMSELAEVGLFWTEGYFLPWEKMEAEHVAYLGTCGCRLVWFGIPYAGELGKQNLLLFKQMGQQRWCIGETQNKTWGVA